MFELVRKILRALQELSASGSRPFLFPTEQPSFLAVREDETIATSVTTGTSNLTLLQVAAGHSRQVDAWVVADQAVEVKLRLYAAGRAITADTPATTLVAGTPVSLQYTSPPGVEAALVVTNATGSTAAVSAWLRAI